MKRSYRLMALTITVVVLAGALSGVCGTPSAGAAGQGAPARYPVASTSVTFTDHSRPTPANNGAPALPYRTLATLLVYPTPATTKHRQFPLIVFSHGFGATAASLLPTLQSLASHGYVVAAPDFPLTTTGLPGGLDLLDYSRQPGDVSFVITQMLKLDRTGGSPVYQEIEAKRIGVAGHSLGAVTTLAVTYNSCCRDVRIDAAAELDGELNIPIGPTGNFAGTYFKGRNPPLLIVNGTQDTISPYPISKALYAKAPSPKYFLSLIGAPHEGFAAEPWSPVADATLAAFFDRYLGPGATVAKIQRVGTKPGVATLQANAR
jgi:fermentation-respiration switch protein FrsA (DUF1100 family)